MPFESIDLPHHIDRRLTGLPIARQRRLLEQAINAAIDAATIDGWYVNVTDRKTGTNRGHVGPIPDREIAAKVEDSWIRAGYAAAVSRAPAGVPMTNVFS